MFYKGNCIDYMRELADCSVDVILTDPPYLYLKNQKLDRPFDEASFFSEAKRVLTKKGFIVLFGRGTSFYRWNTMLADLGFTFKEEVVWDKVQLTSPLMAMSRVHETASIHAKDIGRINKVKVPYVEMKKYDIPSIITDMKRVRVVLNNTKSLNAVLNYLETNDRDTSDSWGANNISISSDITKEDRSVSVMRSIKSGMNERSIVRTDFVRNDPSFRYGLTGSNKTAGSGDRSINAIQSVIVGMNEKTIIKESRDHYTSIHPTQKPVRLLERLLALVLPPDKPRNEIVVLDPFAGSFSTVEAANNLGCNCMACEIDEEYYGAGVERIINLLN